MNPRVSEVTVLERKRLRLRFENGEQGIYDCTCRRCGVSRPTLRKRWRRYQAEGAAGLRDRSRRPHHSPSRRVFATEEDFIVSLRKSRQLGIKRLRNELRRLHGIRLSVDTIHKVLSRHGLNRLKRPKLVRKRWKRYPRPVPGDRVQMDVCKIGAALYHYTAIDDCSRYQVIGVFQRKTAASTLSFLEQVVEEMSFSIQRIQTDRGQEFFTYPVQDRLREWSIKFRPIRPRAPLLNGKVDRMQRTALEGFCPTVDLRDPELEDRLAKWQHFYNWDRPHDGLGDPGQLDRLRDLLRDAPTGRGHRRQLRSYDPSRQFILPRDDSARGSLDVSLKRCGHDTG